LTRDKFNLLILFGQAPIIAFSDFSGGGRQIAARLSLLRDGPGGYLVWDLGGFARNHRERAVYTRERMVNLRLFPYVWIKTVRPGDHRVFAVPAVVRLFEVHALHRLLSVPGWAIPQVTIMLITAMVGIALGLFISAIVKTSEMATSMVPLDSDSADPFLWIGGGAGNMARVNQHGGAGDLGLRWHQAIFDPGHARRRRL
jgi:hypothetical protein